jgi:putative urate catabolism protein
VYPRDLRGYGQNPPDPRWPGGARLAVQFVINYEEGGEHSILHGDRVSESFLTEEPKRARQNIRDLAVESMFEYGSRAGFWRLYRLFTERDLPVTIFGVTTSLARNPEAVAAMKEADWEIASHGYRWIDYSEMPRDEEAAHIRDAVRLHTEVTGERPTGYYLGRMSANTRPLLVETGGFVYDADSFADDLPYWTRVGDTDHLVVPYTLDNNDGRYVNSYGFASPDFSSYLERSFDLLLEEGAEQPKMMSIGLHTRLVGRPGRAADLRRFLDKVAEARDRVWVTRRIDIARHWHEHHPPEPR